jgi:glyoxylase-like metal-dependent hydrolase (beta-lactamase superfamily II)
VFDCGTLEGADLARFHLKADEVATARMSVACFLVVHPRGALMWDVGAVPDGSWTPTGQPVTHRVVLPDAQERTMTVVKPLREQLVASGYAPSSITYLALSHYHWDHTANANDFAGATWLVRPEEHDAMFPASGSTPPLTQPSTYRALRTSKTVLIHDDEYDVFGDRTVIAKKAPGHTLGHQVLYVQLPKTGGVVLSGDLYHYPEERVLKRVPTFEFNPDQTVVARATIDAFLAKTGAQLWIQHDFEGDAQLKKAPAYYD